VPGGSATAYDYVNQDPINNFDLDGRWCLAKCTWKKIKKAAKAAAGAAKSGWNDVKKDVLDPINDHVLKPTGRFFKKHWRALTQLAVGIAGAAAITLCGASVVCAVGVGAAAAVAAYYASSGPHTARGAAWMAVVGAGRRLRYCEIRAILETQVCR
jgi:hypothetical protein